MGTSNACDWADVQGLVLRGYRELPYGACLFLQFRDSARARTWLRGAVPHVSSVRSDSRAWACNIALSHAGLGSMQGFESGTAARSRHFSRAFVEGMTGSAHRTRVLGDAGSSLPSNWEWGPAHHPVHAMVFICGATRADVDATLERVGPVEPHEAFMVTLPKLAGTEHFGFRDGVSQPILEGSRRAGSEPLSHHLVKLGEVLLGYPDNGAFVAPVPSVPGFDQFGRNGTYLVCRQLAQDVGRFLCDTARAAEQDGCDTEEGRALVRAKLMGRWQDGRPLLPPGADAPSHEDNEFGFQDADRIGLACPIGAHIRRANPRDSLEGEGRDRWSAVNRHRIVRRGRSYGSRWTLETAAEARGLLFVALNSDIERQFEFIQQNWFHDPGFGGLPGETDPVLSEGGAPHGFATIPGFPARRKVRDLGQYVRTCGGEYFFLPSLSALRFLAETAPLDPAGGLLAAQGAVGPADRTRG